MIRTIGLLAFGRLIGDGLGYGVVFEYAVGLLLLHSFCGFLQGSFLKNLVYMLISLPDLFTEFKHRNVSCD